jgi:hypothetical protein
LAGETTFEEATDQAIIASAAMACFGALFEAAWRISSEDVILLMAELAALSGSQPDAVLVTSLSKVVCFIAELAALSGSLAILLRAFCPFSVPLCLMCIDELCVEGVSGDVSASNGCTSSFGTDSDSTLPAECPGVSTNVFGE